MQQEGSCSRLSALFYRVVIQTALLFGSDSWTMSNATMKDVEGTHEGLLFHIKEKQVMRQADGDWETPEAEELLRATGMQSEAEYIGLRQATVV